MLHVLSVAYFWGTGLFAQCIFLLTLMHPCMCMQWSMFVVMGGWVMRVMRHKTCVCVQQRTVTCDLMFRHD